jgi:VIT1/CCC1 family predicted Fe2+/Mn2+ transporter
MAEEGNKTDNSKKLRHEIREYIEKRIEYVSINLLEQLSLMIAHSFQRLIGVLLLVMAFFFVWFAFAFYLSGLVGSQSAGFALASLPLFFLGFIFFKNKSKRVTERIQAELIGKVIQNFDSRNGQQDQENNSDKPESNK